MRWMQLSFEVAPVQAEALEDALLQLGAAAVTLEDDADQPIYEPPLGTTPLWDRTRVTALLDAGTAVAPMLRGLSDLLGRQPPPHRLEILEDKDWSREWMRDFHAMPFGRKLWICPSWQSPPQPAAVNLMLDPGLAFGSGTHPTTALCLEWLDGAELAGTRVLDYGCGSGVLAIAALLLGSAQAVATDIDPQALQATRDNATRNGIGDTLVTCLPQALPPERYHVVLANILAGPLLELADRLCDLLLPGGKLVLSGILAEQATAVSRAYGRQIRFEPVTTRDGWARLAGTRHD